MKHLSRRDFLRSAGLAGAGLVLPGMWQDQVDPPGAAQEPAPITHWDGSPAGRILLNVMTVYSEPSWRATHTGFKYYDDVVAVLGAVSGEGLYYTNSTWLQIEGGFVYSSWVQPVADRPNNPIVPIGEGGAWGEVTVPITMARGGPGDDAPARHHAYYSQMQRIIGVENDYYLAAEIHGGQYWLKAAHVRIVPPEEIAPISGHVPPQDKRIEVGIRDQVLRAYEGEQEVYSARVATGVPDSPTSFGEFHVIDKRIGQRMVGGQTGGGYNLPGIPWICYFTYSWIATHGCYWHNDYGRRHSNGCVNLSPLDAKWVFRWTTPVADYWDFHSVANEEAGQPGTRVIVKW